MFRRNSEPLYAAWLNKGLKSEIRATVLSMRGQIDAIGQIVGGPIIGLVATTLSLRAAMVGVSLLLAPTTWLYGRALQLRVECPYRPLNSCPNDMALRPGTATGPQRAGDPRLCRTARIKAPAFGQQVQPKRQLDCLVAAQNCIVCLPFSTKPIPPPIMNGVSS